MRLQEDSVAAPRLANEVFWYCAPAPPVPWPGMRPPAVPQAVPRTAPARSSSDWCGATSMGERPRMAWWVATMDAEAGSVGADRADVRPGPGTPVCADGGVPKVARRQ